MMAGLNPDCTRSYDQRMIEPQSFDGSMATWRQADDLRAVFTPGKVLMPTLLSGMK